MNIPVTIAIVFGLGMTLTLWVPPSKRIRGTGFATVVLWGYIAGVIAMTAFLKFTGVSS